MIQKKVCLIGAFAVGKTSLVSRFVQSIFSEKYHTTVGVKIDKKVITVGGADVALMVWDIAGEDSFHSVEPRYVRGAAGYLLVADGTRRATLDEAMLLQTRMEKALGAVPFVLLLNKSDLAAQWELSDADRRVIQDRGWPTLETSARTGAGVEDAFTLLAGSTLAG